MGTRGFCFLRLMPFSKLFFSVLCFREGLGDHGGGLEWGLGEWIDREGKVLK